MTDNEAGWALLQKPDRTPADVEEAIRLFRRSIELDPAKPEAVANLGNALVDLGREREAIEELERIAAGDGVLAGSAHNWLGWKVGKEEPRRAIGHLREAVRLRPTWGVAWLNLARALDAAGDAMDGCRAYGEAITCGDSHDDTFARDRRLQLEMQVIARGETPPPIPAGAHCDSAAFAIVRAAAARVPVPQRFAIRTSTRDSQAAIIGALSQGRMLGHLIVGATENHVAITSFVPGTDPAAFKQVVFASKDVRNTERTEVVAAAERLLPRLAEPDLEGLSVIDAGMYLRDTVLASAGSRWRWNLASHEPAGLEIAEVAGELGVIVRARKGGGVVIDLAVAGPGATTRDTLEAATPQQILELGEKITAHTRAALAARDVFAARPFQIRHVADQLATLRGLGMTRYGAGYPAWPTAWMTNAFDQLVDVWLTESADGVEIRVGREDRWLVHSADQLQALLPAIDEAVRRDRKRLRAERLEPFHTYRVLAPFRDHQVGEQVEFIRRYTTGRDCDAVYEFRTSRATHFELWETVDADVEVLAHLDRYLAAT